MSGDWTQLRDHLHDEAEAFIDHLIRAERDPRSRAGLAYHRAELVERLTDKAEVAVLTKLLAERELARARANGHA